MNRKFYICLLFAVIAALSVISTAGADYSFKVPSAETIVMLDVDGSMTVSVEYQFENLGQKLDFIDIGLPNNNFSTKDVQVKLNGEVNNRIKVTYADYSQSGLRYGITLEMGSDSIPTGESATVEAVIPNIKKNIFEATSQTYDEQEVEFVGFQFSPNYFGKKFVKGDTDYSFMIVFPNGAGEKQVYYYAPENWPGDEGPEAWISDDGRVVYNWICPTANIYSEYIFGGKFPKSILTTESNITVPGNNNSGGNESSTSDTWEAILGAFVCFTPIVIGFIAIVNKINNANNKTTLRTTGSYYPPQIKTDGEGIKRGLTAVEAAILLETDLERVISMILYGLCKKELITITSQDPLEAEIADPLPETVHDYERNFIDALREKEMSRKRTKMRDAMHRLILDVSKKMEGFSVKETRAYYKSICDKAWSQVEAADTPELKSKLLGDNFGWAMLQDEPEKKLEETFRGHEMMPPYWWWRVDPGYHRSAMHIPSESVPSGGRTTDSSKRSGSSTPSSKPTVMPVLPGAMFARSITNSARGLGTAMVGNMNQFKSSVKNRTNPAPRTSSSSSGSSHHHGGSSSGGCACACACACAGCACACAGGGR